MSKMIAIDLDGTLLDDNLQVSQANIDAINEAISVGKKIVICTGRPYAGMKHFIQEFKYSTENPEYLILGNGTTICTVGDLDLLHRSTLDLTIQHRALSILEQYRHHGLTLAAINDEHFYDVTGEISEIQMDDAAKNAMSVESLSHEVFLQRRDINKAIYMAEQAVLDELQAHIEEAFKGVADTVRSSPVIFEVLPANINKGSSLTWLANHLEIGLEDVAVIGDALNDVSMFEVAGKRIAMENGHPLIREMSDYVTLSNNDSGVAAAILHELVDFS